MKSIRPFFLVFLLGICIGCESGDLCDEVNCGPGDCVEGICDCPCGFSGANCEIEDLCFGLECCNGVCDPQAEACNCNPNYYGESCNILCVNGEFASGNCNCAVGYEGVACEIKSRDGFLAWWSCEQWTRVSEHVDTTFQDPLLGSIKIDCGNSVPEIVLYPTENSNGLMLLNSGNKIVGQVTGKMINFELQSFTEFSVHGSATMIDDQNLSLELNFLQFATSSTEVARGKFILFRHWDECN